MEITFLGTGTSIGVPAIGCHCPVCLSDDPLNKRLRSSIFVRSPECQWVVDTGPDFRTQCLRAGISELDAVLYTHAHFDHVMGFDDLRRFCLGKENSIDIYATESCLAALRQAFHYAFSGENAYFSYVKPRTQPLHGPFSLGRTEIVPLPVVHGKVETIGYLFRREGKPKVAYVPDCKHMPDTTVALIEGVDLLILDALRFRDHPTHLNFDEARDLAERIGPVRTLFTHFACDIDHRKTQATLPPGQDLAYDGQCVRL